ncbi:spore Coat Protein U domain protein [Variibacter gotjawalensis]|uniref:Spore Coat Protein U domain protein n=1 Tax=Variibacter gotjawalensis TaxID=1333996 RepID=A0A0S3PT21_9BRAD|nr:spore coat protein U-like protein [Variibacter gotjawalensis]BAT59087.1 spore Coat Protein U domain protein [Variibacter gotjawalensis]
MLYDNRPGQLTLSIYIRAKRILTRRVSRAAASVLLVSLCFAAILPRPAEAQTATGSFQVLINILKQCTVSTFTNMDFGTNPGIITTPITQTSTFVVLCTGTTPYTVGLDAGTAPGATVTTRQMQQGAARINYALYSDAGRTLNWGNAAPDWVSGTGTGLPQTLTVYGRVPAQVATATGGYTDTITVTVTY